MRFFAGVVVGIVVGRPVLEAVNQHLTPPVRRKITEKTSDILVRLNERIVNYLYKQEGDKS